MATTSLARQLQRIAVASPAVPLKPATAAEAKGKASLLFDPKTAADVDAQTIFSLAHAGLAELASADGRFEEFAATLFGPESLNLSRDQEAPAVNRRLDAQIRSFLQLLSGYLLLQPAQQALEFLIRRYKVHEYNVEDVVACILPYHETNLFVRIVQLLRIEGTRWAFLDGVKRSGAAIPRSSLATRCTRDEAFLDALCSMAEQAATSSSSSLPPAGSHMLLTCLSVIIVEAAASAKPHPSAAFVRRVAAMVLKSFQTEAADEFKAGCMMIAAQLATRCSLSPPLLAALFESLSKPPANMAMFEALPNEHLLLLIHLAQTQKVPQLPPKAFNFLIKYKALVPQLVAVSRRFSSAASFVRLLLHALVDNLFVNPRSAALLEELIADLPIADLAPAVGVALVRSCFLKAGGGSEQKLLVKRLLRALARKFPHQADAVVEAAMKDEDLKNWRRAAEEGEGREGRGDEESGEEGEEDNDDDADEEEESDEEEEGGEGEQKKNEEEEEMGEEAREGHLPEGVAKRGKMKSEVMSFLQDVFLGSFSMPLEETRTTLFVSMDHPLPSFRKAAIAALPSVVAAAAEGTAGDRSHAEIASFARSALLRRLRDEDWAVADTAMTSASADNGQLARLLPHDEIIGAVRDVLGRGVVEMFKSPPTSQAPLIRRFIKKGLRLLTSLFASSSTSPPPAAAGASATPLSSENVSDASLLALDSTSSAAAAVLMDFLLIRPKTRKIAYLARRLASRFAASVPLLSSLAPRGDEEEEGEKEADETAKSNADRLANVSTVSSIAKAISPAHNPQQWRPAMLQLQQLLSSPSNRRCRLLLTTALLRCLTFSAAKRQQKDPELLPLAFEALKISWEVMADEGRKQEAAGGGGGGGIDLKPPPEIDQALRGDITEAELLEMEIGALLLAARSKKKTKKADGTGGSSFQEDAAVGSAILAALFSIVKRLPVISADKRSAGEGEASRKFRADIFQFLVISGRKKENIFSAHISELQLKMQSLSQAVEFSEIFFLPEAAGKYPPLLQAQAMMLLSEFFSRAAREVPPSKDDVKLTRHSITAEEYFLVASRIVLGLHSPLKAVRRSSLAALSSLLDLVSRLSSESLFNSMSGAPKKKNKKKAGDSQGSGSDVEKSASVSLGTVVSFLEALRTWGSDLILVDHRQLAAVLQHLLAAGTGRKLPGRGDAKARVKAMVGVGPGNGAAGGGGGGEDMEMNEAAGEEQQVEGGEGDGSGTTLRSRIPEADRVALAGFLTKAALDMKSSKSALSLLRSLSLVGREVERLLVCLPRLEALLASWQQHHAGHEPRGRNVSSRDDAGDDDGDADAGLRRLGPEDVELLATMLQMFSPSVASHLSLHSPPLYSAAASKLTPKKKGRRKEAAAASAEAVSSAGGDADSSRTRLFFAFVSSLELAPAPSSADIIIVPAVTSLGCITADFFQNLGQAEKARIFSSLISLLSSHAGGEERDKIQAAATDVLRQIHVPVPTIVRHLAILSGTDVVPPSPHASIPIESDAASEWPGKGKEAAAATSLAEMIIWKDRSGGGGEGDSFLDLVPPLQTLLTAVINKTWKGASKDADKAADISNQAMEVDGSEEPAAEAGEVGGKLSEKEDYVVQVSLMAIKQIMAEHAAQVLQGAPGGSLPLDVPGIVACVKAKSVSLTSRAEAISLLTEASRLLPEQVIGSVMDVLGAMTSSLTSSASTTPGLGGSGQSYRSILKLLEAVLPSWPLDEQHLEKLMGVLMLALQGLLPHEQLPLLLTVVKSTSPQICLPEVTLRLLQQASPRALPVQEEEETSDGLPRAPRNELAEAVDAARLAGQLFKKFSLPIRLQGLIRLLEWSKRSRMGAAGSDKFEEVDLAVLKFASSELKFLQVSAEGVERHGGGERESVGGGVKRGEVEDGAGDVEMRDAEEGDKETVDALFLLLLAQVVPRLRPPATSLVNDGAQLEASYELLAAVNEVIPTRVFLRSISNLLRQEDPFVRQKIIRLLIAKVRRDGEEKKLSRRQQRQREMSKEERSAAEEASKKQEAREYAELAAQMARILTARADGKVLTEGEAQEVSLLLEALESISRRFAPSAPQQFIQPLRSIVGSSILQPQPATSASSRSDQRHVSASALQLVASVVEGVGHDILPLLPVLMPKVLSAAREIAASSGSNMAASAPDADVDRDNRILLATGQIDDFQGSSKARHGQNETLLLLRAVAQVMDVMIGSMGALLSPYLEDIIQIVLLRLWSSSHANDVAVGQHLDHVCKMLPEKFETRLLLPPLVNSWPTAESLGPQASARLLQLLSSACSRMDRAAVAAYHARIFDFILLPLDARRKSKSAAALPTSAHLDVTSATSAIPLPAGTAPLANSGAEPAAAVAIVEGAAVAALVSLVMKLSESVFKPIFVRLMEWATTDSIEGEVQPPGGNVARNVSFFAFIDAVTEKLRSVFIPYYNYLLDLAVIHLMGADADMAGEKKTKKKKRQKSMSGEGSEESWMLRFVVLSALTKCFVYDSVSFLDANRFQKIVKPIAAQLGGTPPSSLGPSTQSTNVLYVANTTPSASEMDNAVISCIGHMAVAAKSDVLWKQLNYEVLILTRDDRSSIRRRALRAVVELVERLKEEYIVLLPETIPFLGELLEDTDITIVSETQSLVKQLEELSGEDLAQYF